MNLSEAKQILTENGYLLEMEDSELKEFQLKCDKEQVLISNLAKQISNDIEVKCYLEPVLDAMYEHVRYYLDLIKIYEEDPTEKQLEDFDDISRKLAESSYGKNFIPWSAGDMQIFAVDSNGNSHDITYDDLPKNIKVDHYKVRRFWYGEEFTAKAKAQNKKDARSFKRRYRGM